MWPQGSAWPQWPQDMPNSVEETTRWAELARHWAAANNPQPPSHQIPPPPPPPPPIEDQDDRVFISRPLLPHSNNLEESITNRSRDCGQFPPEDCPPSHLDHWQGESQNFNQPPEEEYRRYSNFNEHLPQPPLPRYFSPNAPPPSYGMQNHPQISSTHPPPPVSFNGDENWMYHSQYQKQSGYSPAPVPPMSYPPPPPPPQGPMTHPPPHGPLFPIGGGPSIPPCPPPHYAPHRFPPPRPTNFPVPEHIIPAFNQAAGPWLQQIPQQPRSALPAWLRDELEKLEKQKRKEQEKLEMASTKGRNGTRDSLDDTTRIPRVRHDSDGAVRMDEGSDGGSPVQSGNGEESEDLEEDQGRSNLGKVREISSYSSAHGSSISALKYIPGMESPPPPITEEEFQAACAHLKDYVINEYHRFIKDSLTDLLLEVTSSAINEVCEETLLQARLAAYGRENDIDNLEDVDDEDEGDDEDKSSVQSSQPAVAGVLGLSAYVSDSESEDGDRLDVENTQEVKLEPPALAAEKPVSQETKDIEESKKDRQTEAQATASPKQPSKPLQSIVDEDKKAKPARDEKEEKKKENTKSSHDEDKNKPSSSSSSLSKGKSIHTSRNRDGSKSPTSKFTKSKTDDKDTKSSSGRHEKHRRSRSRKRSRSRDSSASSRRRRSKRGRSRSRSDRHSKRRSRSRGRRRRSRSSSSLSRSSRRSHRHHHHHRRRH